MLGGKSVDQITPKQAGSLLSAADFNAIVNAVCARTRDGASNGFRYSGGYLSGQIEHSSGYIENPIYMLPGTNSIITNVCSADTWYLDTISCGSEGVKIPLTRIIWDAANAKFIGFKRVLTFDSVGALGQISAETQYDIVTTENCDGTGKVGLYLDGLIGNGQLVQAFGTNGAMQSTGSTLADIMSACLGNTSVMSISGLISEGQLVKAVGTTGVMQTTGSTLAQVLAAISAIENLTTVATNTLKELHPDGNGGVVWSLPTDPAFEDLTTYEFGTSNVACPDGSGGVCWREFSSSGTNGGGIGGDGAPTEAGYWLNLANEDLPNAVVPTGTKGITVNSSGVIGQTFGSDAEHAAAGNDSRFHDAVTVSGNAIQINGQQISLDIGTGSTQVAAGDHTHENLSGGTATMTIQGTVSAGQIMQAVGTTGAMQTTGSTLAQILAGAVGGTWAGSAAAFLLNSANANCPGGIVPTGDNGVTYSGGTFSLNLSSTSSANLPLAASHAALTGTNAHGIGSAGTCASSAFASATHTQSISTITTTDNDKIYCGNGSGLATVTLVNMTLSGGVLTGPTGGGSTDSWSGLSLLTSSSGAQLGTSVSAIFTAGTTPVGVYSIDLMNASVSAGTCTLYWGGTGSAYIFANQINLASGVSRSLVNDPNKVPPVPIFILSSGQSIYGAAFGSSAVNISMHGIVSASQTYSMLTTAGQQLGTVTSSMIAAGSNTVEIHSLNLTNTATTAQKATGYGRTTATANMQFNVSVLGTGNAMFSFDCPMLLSSSQNFYGSSDGTNMNVVAVGRVR